MSRRKVVEVERPSSWRFYLVGGLLASLFVLLAGRVLSLQVLDTEYGRHFLKEQGERRTVRTAELPAYRGVITDRRGEPLAVSVPVVTLYANPQELMDSPHLSELAAGIGLTAQELGQALNNYSDRQFMFLKRNMEPSKAREVLDKKIHGVYSRRAYKRYYPAGEFAAQLVGLTDIDGLGIDGIEYAYNHWLEGEAGKKEYIKALHGESVRDIGVIAPAHPGRDITLSIDLRLQTLQHRELIKAVESMGATSGSIVTLDARTGEVLAMVNYPSFNPNDTKDRKPARMRNRSVTDVYEPGSTMKAMTLVAALESGRYTPQTKIDTDPGEIRVAEKLYRDPVNYGEISLTRVLQKSSQVGTTKVALDLGREPLLGVLQRFGFGQSLATGFPGERAGKLHEGKRWHISEEVSLAFGYGMSVTPLQLAAAYSVFANGGVQLPVSLLSLEGELPEGQPVISPRTAAQVLDVLHAVTGDEGTAKLARVPGYAVGGKTGTVHKAGPKGYQDNAYVALFVGIAPIDDPRLVTAVVINEPRGEHYGGGSAAAPVYASVTEGALRILNIAPSQFDTLPDEGDASLVVGAR